MPASGIGRHAMSHRLGRATLFGALICVKAIGRQSVPVTTLAKPLAEFPEGYAYLNDLRELPDGRVLTIERCEGVVKLLDLASGTEGMVGRSGAGPGEYRTPARLLDLPGDSTAIYDPGNRRYLVVHPDGKPGRFFDPLPTVSQTGKAMVAAIGFSPVIADALGRFYAREAGLLEAGATLVRAESLAVERWDHRSGKLDTIAFHRNVRPGSIAMGPGQQNIAFTTGIQWAVARDGQAALVYPGDYHVEFIDPAGTRFAGKPIPFERIRVSEGHKQQWRQDQKPLCGNRSISMPGPSGRTVNIVPRPAPEPSEWPEYLPPFLPGAAVFAPDGTLWIRRTGPADASPDYDVIDGRGQRVRRVILPKRARLLGFGRGTLYLARVDDDDLQYVQRFRLP